MPLDNMSLDTHITRSLHVTDIINNAIYPENGIFIHGLLLEGARWSDDEESLSTATLVNNVTCGGCLCESKPKQLLVLLPVMYVEAVQVQSHWIPESVGYLRNELTLYECPIYLTSARNTTFVFLSFLKTEQNISKWILAGVALLMQRLVSSVILLISILSN